MIKQFHLLLIAFVLGLSPLAAFASESQNPKVALHTTAGNIVIELNKDKAPATVDNFLQYVKDGFYNGTIFHRVIDGFMVQGGGFTADFTQKTTRAPIKNEANNGLANNRGTLAMARTSDPNSATAQFFINLVDNNFLNHTAPTPRGWGYAVFGKVTEGMDVVDKIAKVRTGVKGPHRDVPIEDIVVTSAEVVK